MNYAVCKLPAVASKICATGLYNGYSLFQWTITSFMPALLVILPCHALYIFASVSLSVMNACNSSTLGWAYTESAI